MADATSPLPTAALRAYEQLLTVEHGTAYSWSTLAANLRGEAARWPELSDQRQKRLDRAEDCACRATRAAILAEAERRGLAGDHAGVTECYRALGPSDMFWSWDQPTAAESARAAERILATQNGGAL